MHHILERERDGHVAPFSLPVIKGQYVRVLTHLVVLCSAFEDIQIQKSDFFLSGCFLRGVCEAFRQTGHHDVLPHHWQQQRGDGIYQHFAGNLSGIKTSIAVASL